jgi:hypothetical protein
MPYSFEVLFSLFSDLCQLLARVSMEPALDRVSVAVHQGLFGVLSILHSHFTRWGGSTCSQRL